MLHFYLQQSFVQLEHAHFSHLQFSQEHFVFSIIIMDIRVGYNNTLEYPKYIIYPMGVSVNWNSENHKTILWFTYKTFLFKRLFYKTFSPLISLMRIIIIAITRSTWMNPPIV